MSDAVVIYSKKAHVACMTLNRPGANNTIDQQLARDLEDICRRIKEDKDIYVVIVTGKGEAFCVGSELEQTEDAGTGYGVAAAIASLNQPVIAVINGDALGAGLELALGCDIRIASNTARFGFTQVAMGLIPTDGGTQRLPRIVGKGKALEMLLTAEIISAEEALENGLVNKLIPPENLMAEAEALAQNIAGKAPIALEYLKETVNKGLDLTMEQGLRLEADLYYLLQTTQDRTEGITAFLQKRPPEFKGK